jgi:hypothetical protein
VELRLRYGSAQAAMEGTAPRASRGREDAAITMRVVAPAVRDHLRDHEPRGSPRAAAGQGAKMSKPEPGRIRELGGAFEVAIRAMGQPLVDASAAVHEIAELDPPKDERDAEYDRLLWLGKIVDGLSVLCAPRLRLLAAILDEVIELEETGEAGESPATTH